MKLYRHGDVVIREVDKKINGKEYGSYVLAEGETTGHKHLLTAVPSSMIVVCKDEKGFFFSTQGAVITHEEHKEIKLPAGNYEVVIKREYDYFLEEIKQVKD